MGAFLLVLAAKMVASAAVVVIASYAVERAGPLVGAMIATLPLSAGPAYVFLALDHEPDFLREAAVASLPAISATGLFILAYAGLARRRSLAVSLGAGLLVWVAAVPLLRALAQTLAGAAALAVLVLGACLVAARTLRGSGAVPRRPGRRRDVAIRAGIVMTLVAAVVLVGRAAGPAAAGVLALAPVVMVSLAVILHPRIGGGATARVLVLSLPGLAGFVVALAGLALTVERLGAAAALSIALLISLAWNGAILLAARHRSARPLEPSR
ncbi:hypothetical protein [uncultured Methylobacterium sp.]|jgi:uncharacterized membrane protein (GlpM family)|uniref:hypothetical protein n=1 Tax=uncultured Methylobacterium sp. TaxID=157278 RepID=UPI00262781DC|nr:hypothetical protein [uncultured Methylobacterium sp.]